MVEIAWIVMGLWAAVKIFEIVADMLRQRAWDKINELNQKIAELER